jgi:cell division septation protein DedD
LGKFGIQLAAFSGDNRNSEAATFQRRLKENAKMDSQIIPGTDGYTRVIITGFNTREEANKAMDGIKQKAGLTDVYIRPLP